MKTEYHYTKSNKFIENLNFEYFETYSLLRGNDYKSKKKLLKKEFKKLKKKDNLNFNEENRIIELDKLLNYSQLILNEKDEIHYSAIKTNTFHKDGNEAKQLVNILQTNIINKTDWMCAPFYRDAILFYDKNKKLITPLNVCLSCSYMSTFLFNHQIEADDSTYDLLRSFFIDLGHNVENE